MVDDARIALLRRQIGQHSTALINSHELIRDLAGALLELKEAVRTSGLMNDMKYDALGVRVNNVLDRVRFK